MELKRLRYLVTVADEGSISAAARRLYMTQPPLSMQLRLLEEEVGCPLFERGARTVRLTEPGRRLVERARVLLEQEQAALREVRACAGEGEVLDLGVVSSVASTRLPQWLSAFAASGAPLRLRLIEADTFRLLDELRAGRVQLAIVRTPCRDDGLSRLRLAEEPLVGLGRVAAAAGGKYGDAGGACPAAAAGLSPMGGASARTVRARGGAVFAAVRVRRCAHGRQLGPRGAGRGARPAQRRGGRAAVLPAAAAGCPVGDRAAVAAGGAAQRRRTAADRLSGQTRRAAHRRAKKRKRKMKKL